MCFLIIAIWRGVILFHNNTFDLVFDILSVVIDNDHCTVAVERKIQITIAQCHVEVGVWNFHGTLLILIHFVFNVFDYNNNISYIVYLF